MTPRGGYVPPMSARATSPAGGASLPFVEGAFRAASSARGRRIFHPRGEAWSVDVVRTAPEANLPDVPLLRAPGPRGVLRVSRGLGLPVALPDAIGVALRIEADGGAQDLLLVSSLDGPLLNRVIRPAWVHSGLVLSTILPVQVAGCALWFGARLEGPEGPFDPAVGAQVTLLVARRTDRFRPWATATLRSQLPRREADALRFDPWNCAVGVQPAGLVNRLRPAAYRGSRSGRGER